MENEELFTDEVGENLTDRQKLFCTEYLSTKFNGTQAAINAGYSAKTADQQASRLLTNVKIIEFVESLKADLGYKLGITRERIAKELAKIAFYDPRKLLTVDGGLKDINTIDDETAVAIAGIELYEESIGEGEEREKLGTIKKIKIWDKRAALSDLNKMLGYNEPEKRELTGVNGTPLIPLEHKVTIKDYTNGSFTPESQGD